MCVRMTRGAIRVLAFSIFLAAAPSMASAFGGAVVGGDLVAHDSAVVPMSVDREGGEEIRIQQFGTFFDPTTNPTAYYYFYVLSNQFLNYYGIPAYYNAYYVPSSVPYYSSPYLYGLPVMNPYGYPFGGFPFGGPYYPFPYYPY